MISEAVAPPVENPVEVLTKSAPASLDNSQAITFSSSVKRQVSIITFVNAFPLAASTTAFISFFTYSKFLSFNLPTLITISTSVAPFAIASAVSNALTSVVFAPKGNPITVHTSTSVPSKTFAATLTIAGLTHTDAKLYSTASLQSLITSFTVASAFNIVWSIILAICALSISNTSKVIL